MKYKALAKEKMKNPREAFKNEDGAIDLASIMVGIIVIGLIGGVIAATVFAVIPWTQDNAAKQQLDSVVAAQSAYMGLASSVPPGTPAGHAPNSYADSAKLAEANLMKDGANYCAVTTDEGKGYAAFAQAASGKIWSVTNKNTKPVTILAGSVPTDCKFILTSASTPSTPASTFSALTVTTQNGSPTANHGNGNYQDIASTADGSTLVATSNVGYIFKSTDSGVTWNPITSLHSAAWKGIAMSEDGKHITAGEWDRTLWVSNDYGATWTSKMGWGKWWDVSMSRDGKHQVAGVENIQSYYSHDYGATWTTANNGTAYWKRWAISDDGQTIVGAASLTNQIFISKDGGATWGKTAPVFANAYRGVSISANGQTILAAQGGANGRGGLAVSRDGGTTWTMASGVANGYYHATSMSADGTKMTALGEIDGNTLYTSIDSGATWQATPVNAASWFSVASSNDGAKIAFVSNNGQKIHTAEWK